MREIRANKREREMVFSPSRLLKTCAVIVATSLAIIVAPSAAAVADDAPTPNRVDSTQIRQEYSSLPADVAASSPGDKVEHLVSIDPSGHFMLDTKAAARLITSTELEALLKGMSGVNAGIDAGHYTAAQVMADSAREVRERGLHRATTSGIDGTILATDAADHRIQGGGVNGTYIKWYGWVIRVNHYYAMRIAAFYALTGTAVGVVAGLVSAGIITLPAGVPVGAVGAAIGLVAGIIKFCDANDRGINVHTAWSGHTWCTAQ